MVLICENYKDYLPPPQARVAVERLLGAIPAGHLAGVQAVVLTSSTRFTKGKTGRVAGRKYRRSECLGFYTPSWRDTPAQIELIIDNILGKLPPTALRLRFLVDLLIGGTLYHEVGHHLDATIGSTSRTGEAAADAWQIRLLTRYIRRRYWYLMPIMMLLNLLAHPFLQRKIAEARQRPRSVGA